MFTALPSYRHTNGRFAGESGLTVVQTKHCK